MVLWMGVTQLSACSSCSEEAKPKAGASKKAKRARKTKIAQKAGDKMSSGNLSKGREAQEHLRGIEMRVPKAIEEARAVTPEIQAAIDLLAKNEDAATVEARAALTAYTSAHPESSDGWYWLGRTYQNVSAVAEAVTPFQKAVEADPTFLGAHRWLAWALHKEHRCEEARTDLDFAVTTTPEDPNVYVDRGVCSIQVRNWDSLLEDFKKACELGDTEICGEIERLEMLKVRHDEMKKLKEGKGKGKGRGKRGKLGGKAGGGMQEALKGVKLKGAPSGLPGKTPSPVDATDAPEPTEGGEEVDAGEATDEATEE